jgi:hypothetical protein
MLRMLEDIIKKNAENKAASDELLNIRARFKANVSKTKKGSTPR